MQWQLLLGPLGRSSPLALGHKFGGHVVDDEGGDRGGKLTSLLAKILGGFSHVSRLQQVFVELLGNLRVTLSGDGGISELQLAILAGLRCIVACRARIERGRSARATGS